MSANSIGSLLKTDPESTTSHHLYHIIFCLNCSSFLTGRPAFYHLLWSFTKQQSQRVLLKAIRSCLVKTLQCLPISLRISLLGSHKSSPSTAFLPSARSVLATHLLCSSSNLPSTPFSPWGSLYLFRRVWNVLATDCYMVHYLRLCRSLHPWLLLREASPFHSLLKKQIPVLALAR